MAMPPRLHMAYWPRLLPRTIVKTSLCVLGLLLWLLYFYSNNLIYERRSVQGNIRSPLDTMGLPHVSHAGKHFNLHRLGGLTDSDNSKLDAAATDASMNVSADCSREMQQSIRVVRRGDYRVLPDLLPGRMVYEYDSTITLTTHATYELLDNVIQLSRRWAGPISVAVYAPYIDFQTSVEYALWLRRCYDTVANHVTFHFVFPASVGGDGHNKDLRQSSQEEAKLMSAARASTVPDSDKLANESFASTAINVTTPRSSANLCITAESSSDFDFMQVVQSLIWDQSNSTSDPHVPCKVASYPLPQSYRHQHALPYPINVCRNVARLNAKTHFVLASDIELYPSNDVIAMFLKLSQQLELFRKPDSSGTVVRSATSALASLFLPGSRWQTERRVFVLPIFEVDKSIKEVPGDKYNLVNLYRQKKAVYFHKHVCSFCNIIPRLNRWLTTPVPKGKLSIFMTIKRHKPFNRWEPIYIGTNEEPLYDERLTWEGQQDKMTQMYELCLMNYDLAILDNAFLVHRSGIKTKNVTEYNARLPFITQNNKFYNNIIQELHKKHGTNIWCK